MKPYRLELIIPGLPKIFTNGSHGNWKVAHSQRKKWKQAVIMMIGYKKPPKPLQCAKCTFIRVSSNQPDDDNLRASFKAIRDALVDGGVMVGDKPENMPDPVYQWNRGKPKEGYVIVRVEEL